MRPPVQQAVFMKALCGSVMPHLGAVILSRILQAVRQRTTTAAKLLPVLESITLPGHDAKTNLAREVELFAQCRKDPRVLPLFYTNDPCIVMGRSNPEDKWVDTDACRADGIPVLRRFSGGGTGSYNVDHETPGFTDVQVGSYVFMDAQYLAVGGKDNEAVYDDFLPSLTVLATVLNAQYAGRATTDAGAKACTINRPWAIVKGETGMSYTSGSDEFGTLRYEADASRTYAVGDKLELIVSHCDPVVNLYDQMYAVRNGIVEAVWEIAARGRSA